MASETPFGAALAKVRKAQGFSTAYAFYKQREGRKTFGLTFRNYVNLEQGKSVPKADKLLAILPALGLGEHSPQARELVDAYYTALGLEALERYRIGASKPEAPEPSLESLAAKLALERTSTQLSLEQWKTLARDFANNACHLVLHNTRGGRDLKELPELTGLSAAEVKRGVKSLEAVGLAAVSGNRVRCPFEERYLKGPPKSAEMAGILKALREHHARLTASGVLIQNSATHLRLTETGVKYLQKHLYNLMELAALCEEQEASDGSAIYMLWGQLFKIFPR
jgi:transcriptional regulator with XRE-family HTH domain